MASKFSEHEIECPFCGECKCSAVFPAAAYPANPLARPFILADCKHGSDAIQYEPMSVIASAQEKYAAEINQMRKAYAEKNKPRLEAQTTDEEEIVTVVRDVINVLPMDRRPLLRMNQQAVDLVKSKIAPFIINALVREEIILVGDLEPMKTERQIFDEYEVKA